MHGDYPGYIPKEARSEELVEAKDNVLEIPHQEKPAEGAVTHENHVLLNKEELAKAEAEVIKLEARHEQIMKDFRNGHRLISFNKPKARKINASMSIDNSTAIRAKIRELKSNIAFTKTRPEPMSKAEFDKLSPHEKSKQVLWEATGARTIIEARKKHLESGESNDSTLARMIRTATRTAAQAGIVEESNVVHVPENVWPGPEPKDDQEQRPSQKPETPEEEIRKAA